MSAEANPPEDDVLLARELAADYRKTARRSRTFRRSASALSLILAVLLCGLIVWIVVSGVEYVRESRQMRLELTTLQAELGRTKEQLTSLLANSREIVEKATVAAKQSASTQITEAVVSFRTELQATNATNREDMRKAFDRLTRQATVAKDGALEAKTAAENFASLTVGGIRTASAQVQATGAQVRSDAQQVKIDAQQARADAQQARTDAQQVRGEATQIQKTTGAAKAEAERAKLEADRAAQYAATAASAKADAEKAAAKARGEPEPRP